MAAVREREREKDNRWQSTTSEAMDGNRVRFANDADSAVASLSNWLPVQTDCSMAAASPCNDWRREEDSVREGDGQG